MKFVNERLVPSKEISTLFGVSSKMAYATAISKSSYKYKKLLLSTVT